MMDASVALPPRRLLLILAGLVLAEAVVLLIVLGLGTAPIVGGDGPYYASIGHNIADHAAHSGAPNLEADVFRTPGYPAFLAVVYRLSGGSELAVRAVQLGLVGVTAYVVALIAAQCFGRRAAGAAAVITASYVPLVLFSALHLTEVLATLLLSIAVWAVLRAQASQEARQHVRWCAVAAVTIFGLAMVRPSALVCYVLVPMVALLWRGHSVLRRTVTAGGTVVLLVVLLTPWAIRNHAITGRFLPLGAGSGVSLYASTLQYDGEVSPQLGADDFERIYEHVGQRLDQAERRLRSHGDDPSIAQLQVALDEVLTDDARDGLAALGAGQIARDVPTRIAALWSPGDLASSLPVRGRATIHRLAQVQSTVLLLLAATGGFLHRRRLGELWPLYTSAVALTLLHLVFHVEARYSMPERPLLFIFSAAAVIAIWRSPVPAAEAPPSDPPPQGDGRAHAPGRGPVNLYSRQGP